MRHVLPFQKDISPWASQKQIRGPGARMAEDGRGATAKRDSGVDGALVEDATIPDSQEREIGCISAELRRLITRMGFATRRG